MLHLYKFNFVVRVRQKIGQIGSVKPKKKISLCYYEGGLLNRKVVITPSTPSLLNLMLMYIFSRIPRKHKSTLKFFDIYLDRKEFKQSIN